MATTNPLFKLNKEQFDKIRIDNKVGASNFDQYFTKSGNDIYLNPNASITEKPSSIPTGAVPIPGAQYDTREKQQSAFSNIQPIGGTLYGVPIQTTLTTDQMGAGSNIPPATQTFGDVDAIMAGAKPTQEALRSTVEQYMTNLKSQEKKDAVDARIETEQESMYKDRTASVLKAQKDYDMAGNIKNLQNLNVAMAQKEAAFNNYEAGLEGKVASASSIYGRQALVRRQSAVELAGLSAVAQAYQGNIDLANDTAQNGIDALYKPQEDYINNLQEQLDSIEEDLTREDKVRADALKAVLDERTRLLTEEKETKTKINEVMLLAAQNGADMATINKIMKSETVGDAIMNSGQYIKVSQSGEWKTLTDVNGNEVLVNVNTGETIGGDQTSNVEQGVVQTGNGEYYDIKSYATDPTHEAKIQSILNGIGKFKSVEQIDAYIKSKYPNSPVTGNMIANASAEYGVSWEMMVAIMAQDSSMGTAGKAVRTKNPGNVGNTDDGSTQNFNSWQEGVNAVAKNLAWRKTDAPVIEISSQTVTPDGYDVSKFTPQFYNTPKGQQVLNNEQQTFNAFRGEQIVKNYNDVQNKAQSVDRIINSGVGGPGDLALVFEFMKALDPTSVVRESEYESAAKSGNIFAGTYARFNGYLKEKGGFLPENVKKSFLDITNSKFNVVETQYNNLRSEYRRIAASQGLNPENVAPDLSAAFQEEAQPTENNEVSSYLDELGLGETQTQEPEKKNGFWSWLKSRFSIPEDLDNKYKQ